MQGTSIWSILIRTFFLATAACLTLQVSAGNEYNSNTSKENNLPAQPVRHVEPTAGDVSKNQAEPIEEITVIGQKYISSLRIQIIQAEDRAYKIYNALNDDDEYDVRCRMEAPTGTLIKKRTCLPNFYDKATADKAREYLGFIGVTSYAAVTPSVGNMVALKLPIYKSKVKKLALQNPELLDALRELYQLDEELIKVRNAYHGAKEK